MYAKLQQGDDQATKRLGDLKQAIADKQSDAATQLNTIIQVTNDLIPERLNSCCIDIDTKNGGRITITPLLYAVMQRKAQILQYLLAIGANIFASIGNTNFTTWQMAEAECKAATDNKTIEIKQILELAYNIKEKKLTSEWLNRIERVDIKSFGLILAARYGNVNAVQLLLQSNAGLAEFKLGGHTPLDWVQYYLQATTGNNALKAKTVAEEDTAATTVIPLSQSTSSVSPLDTILQEAKLAGKTQSDLHAIAKKYHENNARRILAQLETKEEKKSEAQSDDKKPESQVELVDHQYEIWGLLKQAELAKELRAAISADDFARAKAVLAQDYSLLDLATKIAFDGNKTVVRDGLQQ